MGEVIFAIYFGGVIFSVGLFANWVLKKEYSTYN